jgi:hypothetical protein
MTLRHQNKTEKHSILDQQKLKDRNAKNQLTGSSSFEEGLWVIRGNTITLLMKGHKCQLSGNGVATF